MKRGWSSCLQTFEGHSDNVHSVSFSYDFSRIVSSSRDKTVKVWNIRTGECEQTFGNSGNTASIALSGGSDLLALPSDRAVRIWNARNGNCEQTLTGHVDSVRLVAFSFDSTCVAAATQDKAFPMPIGGTIKIWNVSSGECKRTIDYFGGSILSMEFSRDSAWLVTASRQALNIWNTSSDNCDQTLQGHEGLIYVPIALAYSSIQVASPLNDRTIRIWNIHKGVCDQELKGHEWHVGSMSFSCDSTKLMSAARKSKSEQSYIIKMWNVSNGECERTLECQDVYKSPLKMFPDSAKVALASGNCTTVSIRNVGDGECQKNLEGHNEYVQSVSMSQNSALLASGSFDRTIKIWDMGSSETLGSVSECHDSDVLRVAFSRDATWLASGSRDNTIKIWNVDSGKCERTLKGHTMPVTLLLFSNDSARLASVSSDKTIRIWNVQDSWACERVLDCHYHKHASILAVSFSHDASLLASSASSDWTLKIWNVNTGVCKVTFDSGKYVFITAIAMSHDATQLASGSRDGIINIWNTKSSKIEKDLHGHYKKIEIGDQTQNRISSLAFSRDSTWLASASNDLTVKIWNLGSGVCEQTVGVGYRVEDMSFDPTGSCLHTEFGKIIVSKEPGLQLATIEWFQHPILHGDWIMYKKKRLLWIPSEYRPSVFAFKGNHIGIGSKTEKVWICTVDPDW